MRELDETVASAGFAVRFVTIGPQSKADEFCARHNERASCIGDSDMHTYEAMGLGDFDLSTLQTNPELVARRAQNEAAGFRQDWDATVLEDAARLPGAAVIDSRGVLRYVFRGTHPGDLPEMTRLFESAREALAQ
ncbi:MAG: AhpC/TSA family protein, partial [Candidatus Eremiobacteraeota bacterium]|nr:AhpC/TSA family protein [Candidatus Eremiobacteraeota bacterium]